MLPKPNSTEPAIYQIRIGGHLCQQWTDWFEQMSLTQADNGDSLLTGPVIDQAALHGLLRRVRDLGLPLISVMRLQDGAGDEQAKFQRPPSL